MVRLQRYEIKDSSNRRNLILKSWTIADSSGSILTATSFYNPTRYKSHGWRSQQLQQYRRRLSLLLMGKVKLSQKWGVQMNRPAVEVIVYDLQSKCVYQWQALYIDRGRAEGHKACRSHCAGVELGKSKAFSIIPSPLV